MGQGAEDCLIGREGINKAGKVRINKPLTLKMVFEWTEIYRSNANERENMPTSIVETIKVTLQVRAAQTKASGLGGTGGPERPNGTVMREQSIKPEPDYAILGIVSAV